MSPTLPSLPVRGLRKSYLATAGAPARLVVSVAEFGLAAAEHDSRVPVEPVGFGGEQAAPTLNDDKAAEQGGHQRCRQVYQQQDAERLAGEHSR